MSLSKEDQKHLVEAQVLISQSLNGINATLQKINDQNILHTTKNTEEHKSITDSLSEFSKRWWWVIVLLVVALIILAGAEKILKIFPIGS